MSTTLRGVAWAATRDTTRPARWAVVRRRRPRPLRDRGPRHRHASPLDDVVHLSVRIIQLAEQVLHRNLRLFLVKQTFHQYEHIKRNVWIFQRVNQRPCLLKRHEDSP